jgi:NADH:ubiquinone oxidoreductase subunit 6 (subunit J)
MMMVVGVEFVDAVVVVEAKGAVVMVVVVVVSEPKLNLDEKRKSTTSHDETVM